MSNTKGLLELEFVKNMYRARDKGLSFISVIEIDGTLVFFGKGDTDKEIEMIHYALGKVVDTVKFENGEAK